MGFFRPSREPRGPDPFLVWKMVLFTLGAALGVAGMVTEIGWLVGVGIAALAAGIVLRVIGRPRD